MTTTTNETREKIVECGCRAMIAKSYNGVGLSEILREAGVPKGSFYHHFESKEELGIAVIERSADEHCETLRKFFTDRSYSPIQRLRNFFEWGIQLLQESGYSRECLVAKLALELGNLSDTMRAAIKCGMDQWRSITAQCIREGQAKGEISQDYHPEVLADFLMSSFEGVMIRMQVDRDTRPVREFLDIVFERLFKK